MPSESTIFLLSNYKQFGYLNGNIYQFKLYVSKYAQFQMQLPAKAKVAPFFW